MINGLPLFPSPPALDLARVKADAAPADFSEALANVVPGCGSALSLAESGGPLSEAVPPRGVFRPMPLGLETTPDLTGLVATTALVGTDGEAESTSVTPNALPQSFVQAHQGNGGDEEIEVVEIIALPWHLQANAGLSWQSSSQGVPAPSASGTARTPSAATDAMPQSRAPQAAMPTSVPLASTSTMSGGVPSPGRLANRAAAASAVEAWIRADDVHGRDGWYAPWIAWPDRLLRWRSESEGAASAWVRDFRLPAEQAAGLIDSLRGLADQHGVSLRRIMLNGHELWRAPSNSQTRD